MRRIEREIRHYEFQNKRIIKTIKEYNELIKRLKKSAKWIEEHKITKPKEFYFVITQYEIWKSWNEFLLKSNINLLKKLKKRI